MELSVRRIKSILRNVRAQCGRLWNASITADAPKYAKAIAGEFPSHNDRGRIFARAVVVQALLKKIDPTPTGRYGSSS